MTTWCYNGLHDLDLVGTDHNNRCRACKRRANNIAQTAKRKGISTIEAAAYFPEDDGIDGLRPRKELVDPGFRGTFGRWYEAASSWMEYGLCQSPDSPDMYPALSDRGGVDAARATCDGCAVKALCDAYAVANQELHGIWGGRTPSERERGVYPELRRERCAKPLANGPCGLPVHHRANCKSELAIENGKRAKQERIAA